MILGKRRPVGKRAAVNRRADPFREGHVGVPGAAAINFGTEHQQRPLRAVDAIGETVQALGIWADPVAHRSTTAGPNAGFSQSSSGMDKNTGPAGG